VVKFLVDSSVVCSADIVAVKTENAVIVAPVAGGWKMIAARYLAMNIFKGTALVLLILVSLSLFFTLVQEIDNLGKGQFGVVQFTQYMLLRAPVMMVDFMPLAALLGSILSLGNLASSSELIALQASGMSLRKFIVIVAQSAFVLALLAFTIDNFVVPYSETTAREIKASGIASRASMQSKRGVWIKDGSNIIFIKQLFPNGNARNIEIYHLDENKNLQTTTFASKAITNERGWLLQQVKKTFITETKVSVKNLEQELYSGNLSDQLLQSLVVNPRQMSTLDLYGYVQFLDENKLNHSAESLSMWRKIYFPLTIVVMSILSIPFVTGSQRNSNTGQRIITGIILGLVYVILDKLLIQLGEQLNLTAFLNALMPTLIFMLLTAYLIRRKITNP